jgi:hypothetical protein
MDVDAVQVGRGQMSEADCKAKDAASFAKSKGISPGIALRKARIAPEIRLIVRPLLPRAPSTPKHLLKPMLQ